MKGVDQVEAALSGGEVDVGLLPDASREGVPPQEDSTRLQYPADLFEDLQKDSKQRAHRSAGLKG